MLVMAAYLHSSHNTYHVMLPQTFPQVTFLNARFPRLPHQFVISLTLNFPTQHIARPQAEIGSLYPSFSCNIVDHSAVQAQPNSMSPLACVNSAITLKSQQTYREPADPQSALAMYKRCLQNVEQMCNAEQQRMQGSLLTSLRKIKRQWDDWDAQS